MRSLLLAVALLAVLPGVRAGEASERQRIARERLAAEQRYDAAERACRERFVVTGCIEDARRERREVMMRLRREENLLDEAQRKQRAAERMDAIRRKQAEEEQRGREAVARPPRQGGSAPEPRLRARSADPAASAPLRQGKVTVRARPASAPASRSADEARSRAAYDARQREAQEHLESTRRRNEERSRGKPPSAPLPVPPAPAN